VKVELAEERLELTIESEIELETDSFEKETVKK
jgi:hypothetical protein